MRDDRVTGPADFEIEGNDRFFRVNRSIVEFEIRPGNTVTFLGEVDMTAIERVRRRAASPPSYTAFVVRSVGRALAEFPWANRRVSSPPWRLFSRSRLQRFHHCDVAVACERNLPGDPALAFIDVFRDADRLEVDEINRGLRELAVADTSTNAQWRDFERIVRRYPHWLATLLLRIPFFSPGLWVRYRGAAALISSPAKYGVDMVVGTWSHPLGVSFGLVKSRPVVRGGEVVACPTMSLCLNFDRRVIDGAHAARLFRRLVEILEDAAAEKAETAIRAAGVGAAG